MQSLIAALVALPLVLATCGMAAGQDAPAASAEDEPALAQQDSATTDEIGPGQQDAPRVAPPASALPVFEADGGATRAVASPDTAPGQQDSLAAPAQPQSGASVGGATEQPDSAATAGLAAGVTGSLSGQVSIGPLRPGPERAGASPSVPPADACVSRGLVVLSADGQTEVARFRFNPDCTFSVELPAGTYLVALDRPGIDRADGLPRTVVITSGQVTRLDVSIDTGLR